MSQELIITHGDAKYVYNKLDCLFSGFIKELLETNLEGPCEVAISEEREFSKEIFDLLIELAKLNSDTVWERIAALPSRQLFKAIIMANYLDCRELVGDMACTIARNIEKKSSKEMKAYFYSEN